jgi:quercetin dioxygenase-like cupin family protein
MDMDTRPYALAREEGQALWFLGTLVIVKATDEQTGGAFGLIDNVLPGGFASPYHLHRNEDESFYVAEGEMTFYVGEERIKAAAGAFVYGPRGVPHGFEVEEHWVEINLLGLVQQLGVATIPGPGLVARMLVRQARKLRSRLSTGRQKPKPSASLPSCAARPVRASGLLFN